MHYIPVDDRNILSLSTEDGRILFYSTQDLGEEKLQKEDGDPGVKLPPCLVVGQLGGAATGFPNRIKDYSILTLSGNEQKSASQQTLFVITAGSDGAIRVWAVEREELLEPATSEDGHEDAREISSAGIPQVGRLLGTYETGNRITCLQSFLLTGEPEDGSKRNAVEQDGKDESEESSEENE
jgi:protein MAK11